MLKFSKKNAFSKENFCVKKNGDFFWVASKHY
jgi:hypothetical protein